MDQQLSFIIELDKLKTVLRQTPLTDRSRRENSAEHSWHLAMMAFLLAEYAPEPVDVCRVVRMVLVHDVVEIDAGDTPAHDVAGNATKPERERKAADRIFALLPEEQGRELRALWEEFEAMQTPEAKYANSLDRLQPLLNNSRSQGGDWKTRGARRSYVLDRMQPVRTGLPKMWPVVMNIVDHACAEGWLIAD